MEREVGIKKSGVKDGRAMGRGIKESASRVGKRGTRPTSAGPGRRTEWNRKRRVRRRANGRKRGSTERGRTGRRARLRRILKEPKVFF